MNFFIKYKKLLLIAGFVASVFILGYLLYAMFFKAPVIVPPTTEPGEETGTLGKLPGAEEGPGQIVEPTIPGELPTEPGEVKPSEVARGGLTEISELNNTPTLGTTLDANGSELKYYNKSDGKFYRIDKNGDATLLSDTVFHSVNNVVWSPSDNKAILEYPDGANIIYNFSSDEQITLPTHWKDFEFSPSGEQIVMKSIGLDPNNRWLAISNDNMTKVNAIESIGEKDATVYPSWSPNNQVVAMYTEGVGFDRQEVFFVGLNNENFKSTIVEGRGFQPKWNPNGNQLLYSVYSSNTDLKPSLWIVNAVGESIGSGRKSLNVETWAEKCTFSSDTEIYCAVPEKLEEGAGLFPELAQGTKDNLYKINIQTGIKKLIAVPDGSYNMSNLIISDNGFYLYFTDKITEKLQKIKLK